MCNFSCQPIDILVTARFNSVHNHLSYNSRESQCRQNVRTRSMKDNRESQQNPSLTSDRILGASGTKTYNLNSKNKSGYSTMQYIFHILMSLDVTGCHIRPATTYRRFGKFTAAPKIRRESRAERPT
jgi:hypothetical protein